MAKVGNFEVVCTVCGSKKVSILDYHNSFGSGIKFKCNECGETTKL